MNLRKLQNEVKEWTAKNFPEARTYQPLLGIVEEVGELSHAHLKQEQGIRGTWKAHQDAKTDAVGDIIIYLAHYCELNQINLEDAVNITWANVSQRDWITNALEGEEN
jgi:NTP pyrophosphatase (non-canonical NTP hydrolase)